ncbi:MAG TPA: DNA polymerase III subunit delta [Devosiaceae bacterium]|nr:DNA polymerase III subunit delta [Devosiaceae bacterium]
MTALKAHEVARYLARPDLTEGVFLAYGPDAGLVREIGQRLLAHLAGKDGAEIVVLDGGELEAEPGRLAVEAKTDSLFGGRHVIRVRGATKALTTILTEFTSTPDGAAIVLEAGNLTPRDALRALVEAGRFGRALPCFPDSDETRSALIAETFSKGGIAVAPDVVTLLRDLLGNDREITRRELEKLSLFASESGRLTETDVLTLCADNAALVLDDIADSTGSGRAEALDDALRRALAVPVNPQQILATSLIHFTGLRRWRTEVDAGRSVRDVLDGARPKPHFSRRALLEQQLRLWSDAALATATARLHATTAESRRRPALAEALLQRTLLALCRMAAEH